MSKLDMEQIEHTIRLLRESAQALKDLDTKIHRQTSRTIFGVVLTHHHLYDFAAALLTILSDEIN